jgi:hypothetical protein
MLAAVVLLSTATLSASPISGAFDFGGSITVVDNTQITWSLPPANKSLIVASNGSFSGLVGTDITIRNLTNPPDIVDGGGFPNQLFISFDAAPLLPNLLINYIAPGVFSAAACGAAPAVGQVCTLPGSPFSFINTPSGSSATFDFTGVTSDGLSTWSGVFTSNFTIPYQTVFSRLATVGSITNSYSGTITAVPEPNTVLMVLGAFGVLVGCWRRKRTES